MEELIQVEGFVFSTSLLLVAYFFPIWITKEHFSLVKSKFVFRQAQIICLIKSRNINNK